MEQIASTIRDNIVMSLNASGSGHAAGSLGLVEVFTSLYFSVANIDPENPYWPKRDRIVLSNGHTCPVLYATLAERGYFSRDYLMTLRKKGSLLQGHPKYAELPGIENSSGPLGQGVSQASGMAWALKRWYPSDTPHVWCIVSDGEHQEGQLYEAISFIGHQQLANITLIIDRNSIQISGLTDVVQKFGDLKLFYQAKRFEVFEVDGNNLQELNKVLLQAKNDQKPTVVIADTIPGCGVSFVENDFTWHGKVFSDQEMNEAIREIWRGGI